MFGLFVWHIGVFYVRNVCCDVVHSQQSPRLDRMAYMGEMQLLSVYCPLSRLSPWLDGLAVGETVDCKCIRSAICLPTVYWGTLQMHKDVHMMMYMLAVWFMADSLSTLRTHPEKCSLLLWVSLSMQAVVLTRLAVLLEVESLSQFLGMHGHSLISLFNSKLTLPACDIIKNMTLYRNLFIGCTLQ